MSLALSDVPGKIFRVDPLARRFELLKETEFDPQTQEGRSREAIEWDDRTRFTKVVTQNSFAGITGEWWAQIEDWDRDKAVVMKISLTTTPAGNTDSVPFRADPAAEDCRGASIELAGKPVRIRLRGPRAEVTIRTATTAAELSQGFWATTLTAHREDDRLVADRLDLYPQVDPRAVDDPRLPRILVIGDSISMNYHEAAKAALRGIANYYRIDGNGGPSDRGVVCAELWLGDYTQPGLHWDVIQFNHGLHDLKQQYDAATATWGSYQVPVAEYKANLEREIQILKRTGATLVWCTTTPVPNDATGGINRRKDEDLVYNQAALEVVQRHPEIHINDLNRFVRSSPAFDKWREGKDVHFWDQPWQAAVGRAVADALVVVLRKRH